MPPLLTIFLLLLGPYHFCLLLCHLCMKCSLGILIFLKKSLLFLFCLFLFCFPLFLCIAQFGRLSYLSLLFFGIQHSDGYIFPFLLCLLLLFFSQLFLRLLRESFFLFTLLFLWDGLDHCLLYNVMNLHP